MKKIEIDSFVQHERLHPEYPDHGTLRYHAVVTNIEDGLASLNYIGLDGKTFLIGNAKIEDLFLIVREHIDWEDAFALYQKRKFMMNYTEITEKLKEFMSKHDIELSQLSEEFWRMNEEKSPYLKNTTNLEDEIQFLITDYPNEIERCKKYNYTPPPIENQIKTLKINFARLEECKEIFGPIDVVVSGERATINGDHSDSETVLHFVNHDVYVGYKAYYDSWNGTDYSDSEFYECVPKQITYTAYPRK